MKDNYYLDIILKGYEESLRAIQFEETFSTFESRSTLLNMGSTKYSDAEFYQIWINSDPIKKLIERIGKDEFISYEAKSRVEVEAWGKLANFFDSQQKITEKEYFITNTDFFKNCLNVIDKLILNLKKIDGNTESIFYYEGVQGSLTDSVGKGFPYCNEINSFVFIRWHIKNTLKNAYKIEQDLLTPQKPQQPETTPLNLSDTTKNKHGIMENFEIKQDISQGEMRDAIRIHIQLQYEISLEEFLQTNHLADEFFYINYIDKNQKERLQELEKEVSFFDISEGKEVTDDIADQWYNESITRDHYWYYKEYQMFLKERLTELEKIKTIGKGKKSNFDITKEVDDFEVFSNNFETEITTLFNQNIPKNEKLNTYYKDYFPKYLTRVNDIVSHIEQMENDFKLNFPELQTDLQNLNTITSKFKKSILNDLETALNTVLKIDYERLLFEYLNITNKLETDLKIEEKKISTLFEIFYNRMLHIKSKPQPQQPQNVIIENFEANEFNYKSFFDNIDNISYTQERNIIQKETNNFDVFLLCEFYTEFYSLVCSYKIDRIKFSELDVTFSEDIENNLFLDDNSLLSYIHYRMEKGKLIRKRTNIKFELIEPIDLKYFSSLYNVLHHLESNILNHATKEQLSSLESKPQQTEPLDLSDISTDEKITFENKFDKVNEAKIIEYFKKNLVEKKYLTENELNKYLKQAFELRTPPKQKYSFKNIDSIENIVSVFYKYYKDVTTESTHGRQTEYFNLLKSYFNGFEKIHIKNFSKQYVSIRNLRN